MPAQFVSEETVSRASRPVKGTIYCGFLSLSFAFQPGLPGYSGLCDGIPAYADVQFFRCISGFPGLRALYKFKKPKMQHLPFGMGPGILLGRSGTGPVGDTDFI